MNEVSLRVKSVPIQIVVNEFQGGGEENNLMDGNEAVDDVEEDEEEAVNESDQDELLIGERQREVKISVEFLRFGEIDTMNEKYYAEICIQAKWFDDEQHHIRVYDPKKHWNPGIYIENALLEPKEVISYEIKKFYDMIVVKEIRHVKGYFWEKLELENFPMDIQELSIVISSKLKHTQVEFKSDPDRPSSIDYKASKIFVDQQKWYLYKFVKVSDLASYDIPLNTNEINNQTLKKLKLAPRLSSTTIQEQLTGGAGVGGGGANNRSSRPNSATNKSKTQPKYVASCYCARRSGYYMFNAYFIIFLTTALSLTIFSIHCKMPHSRLQTSFTLVLTSASFKWVINRSLPTISYMTSLDKYAIVSIFYLCCLCIWHAVVGSFWSEETAGQFDMAVFVFFLVIFTLMHIFLVVWFFRAYKTIRDFEKLNQTLLKDVNFSSTVELFKI